MNVQLTLADIERQIKAELRNKVDELKRFQKTTTGPEDAKWYYLTPMLMDGSTYVTSWFTALEESMNDSDGDVEDAISSDRGNKAFLAHMERLKYFVGLGEDLELGKMPDDLISTLTDMVLGSPAVCIYRANGGNVAYATSLAKVFVNYFNTTEATAIVELAADQYHKSILFYYKWEDFDPAWFISDDPKENRVLMVEKQCTERFIEGCRALANQAEEQELELSATTYSMTDGEIETLLAKTVPTGVAALQSAQSAVFVEQKASINTPAGHGEMAEEAITLVDRFLGLDATVVGRDNAKDGADRVVNEIFIQTKYYNSARGSLEACFRPEDGMYRYMKDGQPMQLEVPKDQYERVLQGFERKIEQGKVPGVTDPKEARKIVRKGRLTYNQAVNLTKPGTIESLTYDAMTGAVMCSCAFGITFVATVFLTWRKTGDIKQAVKAGMSAGVQVFGISFVQHMVVSQIARTGLANALLAPSQYVVGKLGYQASATIVNGIRALSGKGAIYGAAASKHLAKILRSNVITSALTFAVFSIPETYNLASKKISAAQYTKNMTVLLGSIAGGAGGAVVAGIAAAKIAGAAGTAVAPGVGTAVGIAGGFVGGVVGAKAVDVVGDILHEDDVEILGRLFNAIVSCMIGEYFLDAEEMDQLMGALDKVPQKDFKTIFGNIIKAEKQENAIRDFLRPHFEEITAMREPFALPSGEIILESLMEECAE